MLIKFVKPDPRAGDVVRLDSQRAQQFIDAGTAERVQEGGTAPVSTLRDDGPTVQEYVEAGYLAVNYPPTGYAAKSTPEEIAAAVAVTASADRAVWNPHAESAANADSAAQKAIASEVPAPAAAPATVAKAPAPRKAPTAKK